MGRRAVRNIHEKLDLTGRLLEFDDLPQPWDRGAALFGPERAQAPLEVELGTGKGLFLRGATADRPEHNFLGLEVAFKYARFAAANLVRDGRTNAAMVAGDGLRVFREVLPDASVTAVHVYFPDPWWKARHRKRRVLNEAFLADVARVLVPGGELHFWTDVEEYFLTTLELIAGMQRGELPPEEDGKPPRACPSWPLDGPHDVPEPPSEHHLDFRTHFERRTRLNGEPVYRSRFVRNE